MLKIFTSFLILIFLSGQANAQDKIYWSETSYNKISRANTDGTASEEVLSGNIPGDIVLDTATQKLYWTDYGTGTIRTANVDGSNQQVLVSGLNKPIGLGIEFRDRLLFCVDNGAGRIIRCNLDGTSVATVFSGLTDPYDVSVNWLDGEIFWTERSSGKIFKGTYSGSGKKQVLANLSSPDQIYLEEIHLYWQQSTGSVPGSGIFRSNLDGTNKKELISEFTEGFSVDYSGNRIFWTSQIFKTLYKNDMNGGNKAQVFSEQSMGAPGFFSVDLLKGKIYWLDYFLDNYILQANLDGSSRKTIATTAVYQPTNFVVDTFSNQIFWVNGQSAYQEDKAGAVMKGKEGNVGIQQLVSSNGKELYAIALDAKNGKIYWTDVGFPSLIWQANIDGTNASQVVSSNISVPIGLAVDPATGKLYWLDQSTKKIERVNVDGSGRETLISAGLGLSYGFKLDLKNAKMYWTDQTNQRIQRANLDGSNKETVIAGDMIFPRDLVIDADAGRVYWADAGARTVNRANLDGTQRMVIVNSPLYTQPTGLFLVKKASSPVKEAVVASLALLPNPAHALVMLNHLHPADRVTVYDLRGTVVLEKQPGFPTTTLDVSSLPAGHYEVVTFSNNLPVEAGSLIKN